MSQEIDFEKLIAGLETPKPGANDIGKMLDGGVEFMKKIDQIMNVLDKRGFTEVCRRWLIKEYNLNDVKELEAPKVIYQDVPVGIQPLSDTHKLMYEELNKIKEADLKVMLEKMKNGTKADTTGTDTNK